MHRIFLAAALLTVAACDDPAPVGVDLVDQQSGEPFVISLKAPKVSGESADEITGNSTRALFGTVDDPDLGRLEAVGYLDFVSSSVLTTRFENNPVTAAAILLATDYVYGDTLSDFTVTVRSIEEAWLGSGATSDTTLNVGPVVTQAQVNRRTVTLEIPLPQAWIDEWDTTLRSEDFDIAFYGFEVSSNTGASIVGFEILGSALRAVAGGDTTLFAAARSLTRFPSPTPLSGSEQHFTLQDGREQSAAFVIPAAAAGAYALNRGIVRVPVDTTLSLSAPPNFLRPAIDLLQLDWISVDGSRTPIAVAERNLDRFDFESIQLHDSLRVFLKGTSGLQRMELRVPATDNGVSVLSIPHAGSAPGALLTVTPVQ